MSVPRANLTTIATDLATLDSRPCKGFDLVSALQELDRAILECFEVSAHKIPKHLRDKRYGAMSLAQLERKRAQIVERNTQQAVALVEVGEAEAARMALIAAGRDPDDARRIVEQAETRRAIAEHDELERARRIERLRKSAESGESLDYAETRASIDGLKRLLGQL